MDFTAMKGVTMQSLNVGWVNPGSDTQELLDEWMTK